MNFNKVVILSKQMRQAKDVEWAQMLERQRYGLGTMDDLLLVRRCLVSGAGKLPTKGLCVFGLDVARTAFNHRSALRQAAVQHENVIICWARDMIAKAAGVTTEEKHLNATETVKALRMPENASGEKGKLRMHRM